MSISLETMSLFELFKKPLKIPDYQRSYSWRSNHVEDLLKDISDCKSPYLMGTIILHKINKNSVQPPVLNPHPQEEGVHYNQTPSTLVGERGGEQFDIVDGQQRLVTLTILLYALCPEKKDSLPLLREEFSLGVEIIIKKAHEIIKTFLSTKSKEEREALSNLLITDGKDKAHLQFHVLTLCGPDALDDAFTFFDSVNSKGKALSDFDLLKAHHLMYIPPKQEILATNHNDEWFSREEVHAELFSKILRRLRMWARYQDRDDKQEWADYNEFSSVVEPDYKEDVEHLLNRYMQPAAFRSWRRVGNKIVLSMDYPMLDSETLIPTEITQTIEGGDAFFLYAKRYHNIYQTMFSNHNNDKHTTAFVFIRKLAESIDNRHLRDAFRAVMFLYVDKFGEDKLIEAGVCVELIMSARRWEPRNFKIEGTLKYVKDQQLVPIILNSVNSKHTYERLYKVAQLVKGRPEERLTGVRNNYLSSLKKFYNNELSKITDDRVRRIAAIFPDEQTTGKAS